MTSGGARARSGPAPDPNSYASARRDWVDLPSSGFAGPIPVWPLSVAADDAESDMWERMWRKPQAVQWAAFGVEDQVAAYVRAFVESSAPGAAGALKTVARQLDNELGVSIAPMLALGWRIVDAGAPAVVSKSARRTSSGDWLKAVSVEGA